ncbi:hypothetical protein B0A48_16486 [Cryoendolithus antarcticus]|uniref:CNH domain-containing protein n=1 Tax=Cryoendolithus antarcticus TaxID=1507870 RepID=A0A1V8SEN5_9PEZI|nr:hypothetical protein B0A48_16486 [Cryoendolithus antarcticus]
MSSPPSATQPATLIDPTAPYTLHPLLSSIPLSADPDTDTKVHITTVEHWNGNLYIGTSAGELLHYVSIPGDAPGELIWIIASRLQPPYSTVQEAEDEGVKQILLLPDAGKACVLCNATLSFYTLPELSPAFGGKIKQAGCTWVGGFDLNEVEGEQQGKGSGTVIVICLRQRLRLIRIGDEARKIRDIELGGVRALARRGNLACVADGSSYSLLDVVNEAKIDLFPISSNSEVRQLPERTRASLELPTGAQYGHSRSVSGSSPVRLGRHERNVSLGAELKSKDSSSPWPARTSSQTKTSPAISPSRVQIPAKAETRAGASPEPPVESQVQARPLLPHIASPTGSEFLLTTGTKATEPGVGMFVNLDGDVVRGTIEFTTYPRSLVFDGGDTEAAEYMGTEGSHEGYALALVQRRIDSRTATAVEIQRWDVDPSEAQQLKAWLQIDNAAAEAEDAGVGLRKAKTSVELTMSSTSHVLRSRRLHLLPKDAPMSDAETKRNNEEDVFASRFAHIQAAIILFSASQVQWVVRNTVASRLDARLEQATDASSERISIDVKTVRMVLNDIRGQDARSELEFVTFTYIRQKASLLLFGSLQLTTASNTIAYETDKRAASEALVEGEIDPRILLSLVQPLSGEIQEGTEGMWTPQGLRDTIYLLRRATLLETQSQDTRGPYGDNLLQVLKRYLLHWRAKKGFGSVADEVAVFQTVDAALLHILLLLDQHSPRGPATPNSIRAELNDVVDKGVDCFPRAVELFRSFHRLHLLSRLYQSRKMTPQVLETWQQILEGAHDAGGEMIEGEQDMRRYLSKIRDRDLVTRYGTWLAQRNPKLGVQVFADEHGRVKFSHQDIVALLREKAPSAVKEYLEHLVFARHKAEYSSELLSYYLTAVLAALELSPNLEETLQDGYTTYRALEPPKPTYTQFFADNSSPANADFTSNRTRLLQLLSSADPADADLSSLRAKLDPHADLLVPETIVLHALTGDHDTALHLLTHTLGDYDTAISYCLHASPAFLFSPRPLNSASLTPPPHATQSSLFTLLLHQFLTLPLPARLDRSSELLERFGGFFELEAVLEAVDGDWSVRLLGPFLVGKLRGLVSEGREVGLERQLWGARELRVSFEAGEKIREIGAIVVRDADGNGV